MHLTEYIADHNKPHVTSSKERQRRQLLNNPVTSSDGRETEQSKSKPGNSNSKGQIGWSGKKLYNQPFYYARPDTNEDRAASSSKFPNLNQPQLKTPIAVTTPKTTVSTTTPTTSTSEEIFVPEEHEIDLRID